MKNPVEVFQQVLRGLQMPLLYRNWLTAIADRLGLIKDRPVLYQLRNGISLLGRIGSLDVRLINEIWLDRIYDSGQASRMRPEWVVLDLGANKGYFTARAATMARQVIAVEPNPVSHALCKANITLNGLGDKVRLHQMAVLEKPGRISFHIAADSACCTTLDRPDVTHEITVDAATVTELIADVERIDLLKMDIEGSELGVLLAPSSAEWLGKVERIVMEYHPMYYDEATRMTMVERLESLGFRVITSAERFLMFADKQRG